MNSLPFSKIATRARPLCIVCLLLASLLFAFGCKKSVAYTDYVSECRSNIFLAKNEEFSLRVYAVKKENPYVADGIPETSAHRMEAHLIAPDGTQTVELSLQIGGEEVGGEMSYDNVKCEYFYSRSLDISAYASLPCVVRYGEKEVSMTANSVRTERTLSPERILQSARENAAELFSSLTDEYGFAGEIYIRLLYEDAPYYYVGVIDRTGKTYAFLFGGETGKLLAKRESDASK